jgi:hypothetical protein
MEDLGTVLDALRHMADKIGLGCDVARRLITDRKMRTAWTEMLRQARAAQEDKEESKKLAARLAALPPRWTVEHWGANIKAIVPPDPSPEGAHQAAQAEHAARTERVRACFAFYCCAAIEIAVANKPVKRDVIRAHERRYCNLPPISTGRRSTSQMSI